MDLDLSISLPALVLVTILVSLLGGLASSAGETFWLAYFGQKVRKKVAGLQEQIRQHEEERHSLEDMAMENSQLVGTEAARRSHLEELIRTHRERVALVERGELPDGFNQEIDGYTQADEKLYEGFDAYLAASVTPQQPDLGNVPPAQPQHRRGLRIVPEGEDPAGVPEP
jgi:hypothetical protein